MKSLKADPLAPSIAPVDLIAGMAKGMAVLESFDTQRQRLNATQAAQRAGLSRAAARRHLLTLAHLGYLESDGSNFCLSAKVLRFSGSYLASAQLPRTVMPALHQMSTMTGDSYSVVVLDEHEVVIVARSDVRQASPRSLAYGLHLGARLPAHATSTGRVLLAALSNKALTSWLKGRSLPRLTAHTLTTTTALRQAIELVRTQDFAAVHEEHELGVSAVAVPLRNSQGHTIAALNVVSTHGTSTADLARDRLPLLFDAAKSLRGML